MRSIVVNTINDMNYTNCASNELNIARADFFSCSRRFIRCFQGRYIFFRLQRIYCSHSPFVENLHIHFFPHKLTQLHHQDWGVLLAYDGVEFFCIIIIINFFYRIHQVCRNMIWLFYRIHEVCRNMRSDVLLLSSSSPSIILVFIILINIVFIINC